MENENSNRRRFIRKLAKLGAVGGITALLFGTEKTLIPSAQASPAYLEIDVSNTGSGITKLTSNTIDTAFWAVASTTSGDTEGLLGDAYSPDGEGVQGRNYAASGVAHGVAGDNWSPDGRAVKGTAWSNTGANYGGHFESLSTSGIGVEGYASATSGTTIGVEGRSSSPDGIGVGGVADNVGAIPIVAHGQISQTANLQEWRRSRLFGPPFYSVKSVVDKDGKIGVGTSAPSQKLHVVGGIARVENSAPAGFDIRNTNASFDSCISVGSAGNPNYYANYSCATTTQSDPTKPSWSLRLRVDTDKFYVLRAPPGGSFAELVTVDNLGNLKAKGFITGDIAFANGVKATEEGDGLAFTNPKGSKIAVLDSEGNLHIKGKFISDL